MKTNTVKKTTTKTTTKKPAAKKTPEKKETTKRIKTVAELGLKFSRFELFQKECLGKVRVVEMIKEDKQGNKQAEPWFVGTDVGKAINVARSVSTQKYANLDKDDICSISPEELSEMLGEKKRTGRGGNRKDQYLVSESGLYSLVWFSRKPEAEEFRKWITKVVLPSIAKNGFYHNGQEFLGNEEREKVFLEARKTQAEIERLVKENQELRRENEAITKANKQINARASFHRDQNELLKEQIREMEDEKQLNYELNSQARARYERW